MRLDARAFFQTATSIASGELQGRLEAEQERRQRQLQDYQNALSQFQLGSQIEQGERQRQTDVTRTGLQHLGEIQPGARGGALTALLNQLGEREGGPSQFGLPQLDQIAQNYPWATPNHPQFPIPTGAMAPSPNGQPVAPQPQVQPQPQPQPQPEAAGQPMISLRPAQEAMFGELVAAGSAPPTPTADQQAQAAVQAQFPIPAAAQAQPANPLGNQLTYGLNQQFQGVPGVPQLPSPNMTLPSSAALEALGGPAVPAVQQRQAGVTQYAAAQAGASGSNPAATQPPNTRGSVPDQTPAAFAPGASPAPGAPPPPVPPSASIGTAPQIVPGAGGAAAGGPPGAPQNVVRFPGIEQDFPYGEIDTRTQQLYQNRVQTALSRALNAHVSPEVQTQLQDLVHQLPPGPYSQADAAIYDRVATTIETTLAGLGASIYNIEQKAKLTDPHLVQQFLAILGKSGRANDPAYVRQLAMSIGNGQLAYLADTFAAGELGAGEVRKLFTKAIDKIYNAQQFGSLDPQAQASLLDAARAWAAQLHEPIVIPPEVVLRMTPYQQAQVAQGWARVGISEDQAARQQAEYVLHARGLALREREALGKADKARKLTAGQQLLGEREAYRDAQSKLNAVLKDDGFKSDRDKYYTIRESDTNRGRPPLEVIQELMNSPKPRMRHIATLDYQVQKSRDQYEKTLKDLETETASGAAAAGAGGAAAPSYEATTVAPGGATGRNYGIPGPGQSGPQAMIFTNPAGEKRRVVKDPAQVVSYFLAKHPEWSLQQAQRYVQMMIQEAKRGRGR